MDWHAQESLRDGGSTAALLSSTDMSLNAPADKAALPAPQPSWTKWWVLFWYSWLSGLQSLVWFTWSSVPDSSEAYLHTDAGTLDLLLDWGPVAYCVSLAVALVVLASPRTGLRVSVLIAAGMCFFAACLRCIPLLASDAQRASNPGAYLSAVHVGQFINGAVAPFVVASPAFLSLLWFDERWRNTATAIANVSNAVGRGVGFFLGPAIVASAADLPKLLALEIGLAALPLIAVLVYYPALPTTPPSAAAAAAIEGAGSSDGHKAGESHSMMDAVYTSAREIRTAVAVPSFLALAVAGGLEMAIYGAWSGLLTTVLTPTYTDAQAGALGSVNTFAGIAGGLLVGYVTDHPVLQRHLKIVVMWLCIASAALFLPLALCVSPFNIVSIPYPALVVLCAAAGLLRGGTDPLFFELSAEVVHPAGVSAGVAGGVLTLWYHILLCVMLSIPANVLQQSTMIAMPACLCLSVALLFVVRVTYSRR